MHYAFAKLLYCMINGALCGAV